jgi:succinate dehydrogenase/fumarate reductase flavoprotein subunit
VTKEAHASVPLDVGEVARWDQEADVIVVGLGMAGGAAAIEAARAGAEVLVLERATEGGGTSAESEGMIYFGGGTPVQKACGFEDSPEEMYKYLSATSDDHDDEKLRLFCERSLEHYRWFLDLGFEFKESFHKEKTTCPQTDDCLSYSGNEMAYPFSLEARPAPRGHKPKVEGNAGGYAMERIIRGVHDAGAVVVTNALVETLVRAEDGGVVGLVVQVDGERKHMWARRGVILTCGGFIKNREMLARHAPELLRCNYPLGTDGDDGRGILMGMGVGGSAINMSQGFVSTPFYPPGSHVQGILVNEQGQRFINEDAYHGRTGDAIVRKQGGKAYLIVDEKLYGQTLAFHKTAAKAASIEELEKALGMPEDSLAHTVRFFNRHAERQEDPLFHKHPDYLRPLSGPFVALDCSVETAIFAAFTLGGLQTRATGEVLTGSGDVVPGLYAAGRTTAGIPRTGWGYSSGTSLGGGSLFGRLAGRSAAVAPLRSRPAAV